MEVFVHGGKSEGLSLKIDLTFCDKRNFMVLHSHIGITVLFFSWVLILTIGITPARYSNLNYFIVFILQY